MNRDQLIDAIKRTSVLHGSFTLRSGRTSSYYVDKYKFATKPDILREVGILMAAQAIETEADVIAGAELGGVPLAASASLAGDKPYVLIRNSKKDYGTSKQLEGDLEEGNRVLLVEDVLTTGGQVLEAAKVLKDAGAIVTRIVAVIDRLEGARENIEAAGFEMKSLVTTKDLGVSVDASS
ncbi:MAG: orotate phosphoribosyltransferase [Planctomycetota bacterium]